MYFFFYQSVTLLLQFDMILINKMYDIWFVLICHYFVLHLQKKIHACQLKLIFVVVVDFLNM